MASTLSTLACCAADVGVFAWRGDSARLPSRQVFGQEIPPNMEPIVRHFDFRNYRVRQVAKVTNVDVKLTQLDVWLPVARSDREQRVGGLELTAPARRLPERLAAGDLARHLSTDALPRPGESWEFVVEYPVSVARIETDLARLQAFTWKDLEAMTAPAKYLRREKLIEIDEPRIVERAKLLRGQTAGPGTFARAAYDWVLDQLQYRKRAEPVGVADCLNSGSGECSEYSASFVALCRAVGIPARPAVGFRLNGQLNAWHVWAEFMLPTGEWTPLDGAGGDGGSRQRDSHFGFRDNQLLAVMKAFEVELEVTSGEYRKMDYLQAGVCWWRGRDVKVAPQCTYTSLGTSVPE